MTRLAHLQALAMPVSVTVLIPATIVYLASPSPLGPFTSPLAAAVRIAVGLLAVGLGLVLVVSTIRLFIFVGQGTLAPWAPPRHLVVRGIYRHVRNPMIGGVVSILFGETLLFDSRLLLIWFLAVALLNAVYIPLVEEPGLQRRFGDEYEVYKRNVPRWLPRRLPWTPPGHPLAH